jgi:hypothetical protein
MPAHTPLLPGAFLHGSFHVYFDDDGQHFVAETSPDEDLIDFLQLRSVSLQRVIDAVNEMWESGSTPPTWLEPWIRREVICIYLDTVERRPDRQR